jgi:hypothetical protein
MARHRNPLSNRNRNETFTGAEVQRVVEKLAASKRAKVVRDRSDFDVRAIQSILKSPLIPPAAYSWSIADIVRARDEQLTGRFRLPARLAESMGTDGAIFTARGVRLAPVQSLGVEVCAGRGPKSDKIADEAEALFGEKGIAISSETITTLRSHLTDHGVAFGAITWRPRADGSRLDPQLVAWPIEFVWWHTVDRCYVTQAYQYDEEQELPPSMATPITSPIAMGFPMRRIRHGDGTWVVFSKSELLPHRLDAALLPASLVWARRAFAYRDWNKGSAAHGNPKVVGELPPDTPLTDADGNMTAEAKAFLGLVEAVASQESPVGIRPAGAKIDYMTNDSKAWEVWDRLTETAERDAARIYLGTDGVLGAQGGAPGVDVQALFGVATSKIQSDLACIQRGIQTGLIDPWTALNFGDSKQAPERHYVFPDADAEAVREDFAKRNAAFLDDMKGYRDAGFVVDQALVDKIAAEHGVPAPTLAGAVPVPPATPSSSTGAPASGGGAAD